MVTSAPGCMVTGCPLPASVMPYSLPLAPGREESHEVPLCPGHAEAMERAWATHDALELFDGLELEIPDEDEDEDEGG